MIFWLFVLCVNVALLAFLAHTIADFHFQYDLSKGAYEMLEYLAATYLGSTGFGHGYSEVLLRADN